MRIAVCASEGAPYAKSGGLGDVMEALPAALQRIEGNEVALFLLYYYKIKNNSKMLVGNLPTYYNLEILLFIFLLNLANIFKMEEICYLKLRVCH